MSTKNTIVYC